MLSGEVTAQDEPLGFELRERGFDCVRRQAEPFGERCGCGGANGIHPPPDNGESCRGIRHVFGGGAAALGLKIFRQSELIASIAARLASTSAFPLSSLVVVPVASSETISACGSGGSLVS